MERPGLRMTAPTFQEGGMSTQRWFSVYLFLIKTRWHETMQTRYDGLMSVVSSEALSQDKLNP